MTEFMYNKFLALQFQTTRKNIGKRLYTIYILCTYNNTLFALTAEHVLFTVEKEVDKIISVSK